MGGHEHEGQGARGEVAALRAEVARLAARIAALEAGNGAASAASGAPAGAEALPEETLLAIVAAVSAFLGKRPRLRAIQLLDSAAWSRAGRVSIQASHALSHHARSGGMP